MWAIWQKYITIVENTANLNITIYHKVKADETHQQSRAMFKKIKNKKAIKNPWAFI